MKKILIVGFIIFVSIQVFCQEDNKEDYTENISKIDISNFFTLTEFEIENGTDVVGKPEPLGFIGENYQRLRIHFISVIKNPNKSMEYLVYGKSKVKNNICDFQGTITIEEAFTYNDFEFPSIKQGIFKGKYSFFENPDQNGTGKFQGNFHTFFFIDKDNTIKYNALMYVADGFENNQFEGTWTSYKTGISKKCNWGDYRIPDSQELDNGAGEFGPSTKYTEFGWDSYLKAWIYNTDNPEAKKAREIESEKWWIEK